MYNQVYFETAAKMRGHVLNRVITLETIMGVFLARHFCKTPKLQRQILETIFATLKITFDNKRDAINAIITTDYKFFLLKYPKFNSNLQEIAKQRNIFAHYPLYENGKGLEFFEKNEIVTFYKFKNSTDFEAYTEKSINEFLKMVNNTTEALLDLLKSVNNTPSP